VRASREDSRPSTIPARPRDTSATQLLESFPVPHYEAVVGIIGAEPADNALAITAFQADRCFGARAASARLPGRELDLARAVRTALAVHGTGRFNVVIDALDEAATRRRRG
jgi:hypothetical protein